MNHASPPVNDWVDELTSTNALKDEHIARVAPYVFHPRFRTRIKHVLMASAARLDLMRPTRVRAIETLALLLPDDEEVLSFFLGFLQTNTDGRLAHERADVIRALSPYIDWLNVRCTFLRCLDDERFTTVQHTLTQALASIYSELPPSGQAGLRQRLLAAARSGDSDGIGIARGLAQAARSGDTAAYQLLRQALLSSGDAHDDGKITRDALGIAPLIAAVVDTEDDALIRALLGLLDDQPSAVALTSVAETIAAMMGLARAGHPAVIAAMKRHATTHEDDEVALSVLQVLVVSGEDALNDAILQRWERSGIASDLRAEAVRALAQANDFSRVEDFMQRMAVSKDDEAAAAAIEALWERSGLTPQLWHLIETYAVDYNAPHRQAIALAVTTRLAHQGHADALAILGEMMHPVRAKFLDFKAMSALVKAEPPAKLLDAYQSALASWYERTGNDKLREDILIALANAEIRTPQAVHLLTRVAYDTRTHPVYRAIAAGGLASVPADADKAFAVVMDVLRQAADTADLASFRHALRALARHSMTRPEALQMLPTYLAYYTLANKARMSTQFPDRRQATDTLPADIWRGLIHHASPAVTAPRRFLAP